MARDILDVTWDHYQEDKRRAAADAATSARKADVARFRGMNSEEFDRLPKDEQNRLIETFNAETNPNPNGELSADEVSRLASRFRSMSAEEFDRLPAVQQALIMAAVKKQGEQNGGTSCQ